MSESEWLASEEPDLMLEEVEGMLSREQLMEFVRRCWERITPYLPPVKSEVTVVEQFAALAPQQSDHDAALYTAEAVLKAAGWAPKVKEEQRQQAVLLREIVDIRHLQRTEDSEAVECQSCSQEAACDDLLVMPWAGAV